MVHRGVRHHSLCLIVVISAGIQIPVEARKLLLDTSIRRCPAAKKLLVFIGCNVTLYTLPPASTPGFVVPSR